MPLLHTCTHTFSLHCFSFSFNLPATSLPPSWKRCAVYVYFVPFVVHVASPPSPPSLLPHQGGTGLDPETPSQPAINLSPPSLLSIVSLPADVNPSPLCCMHCCHHHLTAGLAWQPERHLAAHEKALTLLISASYTPPPPQTLGGTPGCSGEAVTSKLSPRKEKPCVLLYVCVCMPLHSL